MVIWLRSSSSVVVTRPPDPGYSGVESVHVYFRYFGWRQGLRSGALA